LNDTLKKVADLFEQAAATFVVKAVIGQTKGSDSFHSRTVPARSDREDAYSQKRLTQHDQK
jgi:hypothetical protein